MEKKMFQTTNQLFCGCHLSMDGKIYRKICRTILQLNSSKMLWKALRWIWHPGAPNVFVLTKPSACNLCSGPTGGKLRFREATLNGVLMLGVSTGHFFGFEPMCTGFRQKYRLRFADSLGKLQRSRRGAVE
jgi:hypothetical protein